MLMCMCFRTSLRRCFATFLPPWSTSLVKAPERENEHKKEKMSQNKGPEMKPENK